MRELVWRIGPARIVGGECQTGRMPLSLLDQIEVELDEDGQPARFWWRRFPYAVEGQPMLFYRRRPRWWEQGSDAMDRVDAEFWRVSALQEGVTGEAGMYDLHHGEAGWQLVQVWADDVETDADSEQLELESP